MRIFSTLSELKLAHASGFRHLPESGAAGFVCDDCGAVKPLPGTIRPGYCGAAGYAQTRDNRMVCFDCADARQRADLLDRSKPASGYVSADETRVTTWTGGFLGRIVSQSSHRNNWGARIYCYSVRDVHGNYWHGRNSGASMCITLRPSKG
jgi:hypothetical protein